MEQLTVNRQADPGELCPHGPVAVSLLQGKALSLGCELALLQGQASSVARHHRFQDQDGD